MAAALPRLVVLALERSTILEEFVEKSDRFATTLAASGTFGFLPGVPSAYTQPLYAWLLAGLYEAFARHWLVVGLAHTALAVVTALLVLALGTRVAGRRAGLAAALITTLHPYIVWHDVHVNREILDGLLLAALALCALAAHERRSALLALVAGALTGVAVLSNARLTLLPFLLAPYLVWRIRPRGRAVAVALASIAAACVTVAPWVVRNEIVLGCPAITTDARALWKANNPHTYALLASGRWIDDVPELEGIPPWPELAADRSLATGTPVPVDECAQMRFYQGEVVAFWRAEPGEKARLAVQAAGMLWSPVVTVSFSAEGQGNLADLAQETVEPLWTIALYVLALWGAFLVPRRVLVLVLGLEAYNTAMAMVFVGTVRYRVPWDFLLALLAAPALIRLYERMRPRARARS